MKIPGIKLLTVFQWPLHRRDKLKWDDCVIWQWILVIRGIEFYSNFSSLEWCELSKHYKCNTVGVRKFPITIIISFFIDKAPRHMLIPKVTVLYCFISILSHTTELLETWASYFPLFGFSLCCHNFQCNGLFLDTNWYSHPPQKITVYARICHNFFCTFLTL